MAQAKTTEDVSEATARVVLEALLRCHEIATFDALTDLQGQLHPWAVGQVMDALANPDPEPE